MLTVPFLTYCRVIKLAKLPKPLAMDWSLERQKLPKLPRPLAMDWSLERSPSGPGAKVFCTKEPACLRRYPNFLEGRNRDLHYYWLCLVCQLKAIKVFFKTNFSKLYLRSISVTTGSIIINGSPPFQLGLSGRTAFISKYFFINQFYAFKLPIVNKEKKKIRISFGRYFRFQSLE